MLLEYGELFRGMGEEDIEEMMQSFRFENCVQRTELAGILAEHAPAAAE
jgi:endoglucanase